MVQQRLRTECLALPSYKAKELPTKNELKKMDYLANVIHEGQHPNDHGLAHVQNAWLILHSTPFVPIRTRQYAPSYEPHGSTCRWRS